MCIFIENILMKKLILILCLLLSCVGLAQEYGALEFWKNLQKHCGKAYEGRLAEGIENDAFSGKKLLMYVRTCEEKRITIPFYVGEDRSRTWILTYENDRLKLKHDHRHEDGSEDKITQYGGTSTNAGVANIQFFPADSETADLIPLAATNVWWLTLEDETFTYNLKRVGTENPDFKVIFDLSKPVPAPEAPWGWEE